MAGHHCYFCLPAYLSILSYLFCSVLFYSTLLYSTHSTLFDSVLLYKTGAYFPPTAPTGQSRPKLNLVKFFQPWWPSQGTVCGSNLLSSHQKKHIYADSLVLADPGRLPPPNLSRSGGPIAILTQRCCSLGRSAVEAADKGIGKWAWFHPGARRLYQYAGSAETVQSFPYACTIKQINSWRGWLCNDISPKFRGFANFLEK